MIIPMGEVLLGNKEKMVIKMIEPPQEDYAEKICHFLEHKPPGDFRTIKQRLYGKYVQYCIDRYFVGEINGQITGQAWYGIPRNGTGVGNFGHVYTEPLHRKKGIATELVKALVNHLSNEKEWKCLLCSAGEDAGKIYKKFGFDFIEEGTNCGPMALIKEGVARNFSEFDKEYFASEFDVRVREGNIRDRHDCDRMLDFSKGMKEIKEKWHRVFISNQIPTFMDALFYVKDGKGITTVIENSKGNIPGYAFVLSLDLESESEFKVLDFIIHPNYLNSAIFFVEETIKIAKRAGIVDIYSFVATCDEEKMEILKKSGFNEKYRFLKKFKKNMTSPFCKPKLWTLGNISAKLEKDSGPDLS